MGRRVLGSVFTVGVLAVGVLAQTPYHSPVIRVATDLVRFDVVVTDRRGHVVPGLTAADFEVVERGRKQVIRSFAAGASDQAPDVHLGVLMDLSQSMDKMLPFTRHIASEFLNGLPESVGYTLVEVDNDVRLSSYPRGARSRMLEYLFTLRWKDDEWTALWDAFVAYFAHVKALPGKHVLVAFTDGWNTSGEASIEDAVRAAKESPVTVFGVGFGLAKGSSHGARLTRIAEDTGGVTVFPTTREDMEAVHRRIVAEVRSQYSLGYVSTDETRDGRWREVQIRLVPKHKNLRVRTKGGYYATSRRSY